MDFNVVLIFGGLFTIASILLVFIFKFGIKEKSYEEALAEQRQQTHTLLGIKPKSKEKKSKKSLKKTKEKASTDSEVVEDAELSEPVENGDNPDHTKKLHVEFKEEVAEEPPVKNTIPPKKHKKEKVRPILIHKEKFESHPDAKIETPPPANHFEEIHPKDEFELMRSNSRDELLKPEVEKPQIVKKSNKHIAQKEKKVEETLIAKEVSAPVAAPTPIQNGPSNGIVINNGKEKKKKKSEFNTLQQLAGDANGPNVGLLLNLVRKAELSRSEVQILIDLLLNKQHEAPAILDDWSEGKSDPVQKLKKQLAEKEKLLNDEQEAAASAQAKLREIRLEYQGEKSQLQQKMRSMDEVLHAKQMEIGHIHQQMQQLQNQLKEEILNGHKLREERAAFQVQRQQLEIRLAQTQDKDVIIAQLQNEVQELSSVNNQMRMELARLNEENVSEKDRQQALILQVNNFKAELEQITERNRQLEEIHHDMERNMEQVLNQENELKMEVARLKSTLQQQSEMLRRLEHGIKQYQDESNQLKKQKEESTKIINQLNAELLKLQEENRHMQTSHMNGAVEETKQHEVEILNLHNELSSVKTLLSQTETNFGETLKAKDILVDKLQQEIEELKSKNNTLRLRNWKVMEALNAAESKIKPNAKGDQITGESDGQKEFLQRLFPEIKELEGIKDESFQAESEKQIRRFIDGLKQQRESTSDAEDVEKLRVQVRHYKSAIDRTEKMLNTLQKHIEEEEIRWRMQLASKTSELESVKEFLHSKLTRLEDELREEQEDKKRLGVELVELMKSKEKSPAQNLNGVH